MGIIDSVLNFAVDRRDRDHGEHREDRMRHQDRQYFEADRANQRKYDSTALQRLRADAEAAGYHPLAPLGAQTVGPSVSFQSQGYGSGGSGRVPINLDDQGASEVNKAQATKLNAEADLIKMQIDDSRTAKAGQGITPEQVVDALGNPAEIKSQEYTPVIEHRKTDPTVADANSKTNRYGESEAYETYSWLSTMLKDLLYEYTGTTYGGRRAKARQYLKKTRPRTFE